MLMALRDDTQALCTSRAAHTHFLPRPPSQLNIPPQPSQPGLRFCGLKSQRCAAPPNLPVTTKLTSASCIRSDQGPEFSASGALRDQPTDSISTGLSIKLGGRGSNKSRSDSKLHLGSNRFDLCSCFMGQCESQGHA